jgi:hypothetical protein
LTNRNISAICGLTQTLKLTAEPKNFPRPMMIKLPFRVTLLLWLVLILTAWNALRLWTSLAWHNVLIEFSARPAPLIITTVSLVWIVTGIAIVWGIWQNKEWTSKLLLGSAVGYTIWYWSERLLWQEPRPNWPFAVILNLALLVFIIFATKSLAREAYERQPPHQKIE